LVQEWDDDGELIYLAKWKNGVRSYSY